MVGQRRPKSQNMVNHSCQRYTKGTKMARNESLEKAKGLRKMEHSWRNYTLQTADINSFMIQNGTNLDNQQIKDLGGTHIFGRTGMCRSNGSLFYKKSLNMGPVFYQKILKHGSTFLTEPKFSGFRMAKTSKITKFLQNGRIFQEKSLKMGTLFCQNHP